MRAAWWWIDRWRKSTAYTDMTLAEQGAYRNLLDELWLRGGVIPNSERILAKIAGATAEEWPVIRSAVLARFRLTTSGWRHDTHDEVAAFNYRQSQGGKARAATAQRDNGRFTSGQPEPAESPAEIPAGSPAKVTSLNQPPSPSPSPSPDHVNISISSVIPINGTPHLKNAVFSKNGSRSTKKLTKKEIEVAERVRHNRLRPCEHQPRCHSMEVCVRKIAYEIREKHA